MEKRRRGILARVGIALLNVLAPGLGLLRLSHPKLALLFFGGSVLLLLWMNIAPPMPFIALAITILVGLTIYLAAIWLSWRLSRSFPTNRPWYARRYSAAAAMLIAFGISFVLTDPNRIRYRSFYVPAEGMEPSLRKTDNFIAYMRQPLDLNRGDVVLARTFDGSIYVKRVAALAGDRIEVRDGVVIINGKPTPQQFIRTEKVTLWLAPETARRLRERFPGELADHQIYDLGRSPGDDFGPQLVRPEHVFLLGDNRDRSADSRFGRNEYGLEQVSLTDIVGRPLYFSWRASRPLGTPISEQD